MLIKLQNGGVKDIYSDSDSNGGCETCDYGSEYINEFTLQLTQGGIEFKVVQMYEFALTEDYMMRTFLENIEEIKKLTELGLYHWLKNKLEEDFKSEVEEFEITTTLQ